MYVEEQMDEGLHGSMRKNTYLADPGFLSVSHLRLLVLSPSSVSLLTSSPTDPLSPHLSSALILFHR